MVFKSEGWAEAKMRIQEAPVVDMHIINLEQLCHRTAESNAQFPTCQAGAAS
ncbi:hypothetical protein KF715C_pA60 (plasmid) [Pseudomonas putida]|uniref:Uncharacterized protein n=1 Tax=Pseudomonas putida TaxID=303 RepID=A0A1L7NLY6_PSEPU|nr:hypothetical protein KF715C_pA60 [Pseudomonas putida]